MAALTSPAVTLRKDSHASLRTRGAAATAVDSLDILENINSVLVRRE